MVKFRNTLKCSQMRERRALNRLIKAAKDLGADAVINVRFTTSQTMAGAAELLAYGTAVKLKKRF